MIQALQSLRGIFALFIFVHHYHYGEVSNIFPAGGDCGVAFFFILSGFTLSIGYKERLLDRSITAKKFYLKRFIRLYPLHLFCFLWALALHGFRPENIGAWIANLSLVQSWVPVESVYLSANTISWCLSDILFFYLIFPFLTRLLHRHRRAFIFVFLAISTIWFFTMPLIPEAYRNGVIYFNPAVRTIDFILGMVLYDFIYTPLRSEPSIRIAGAKASCVEVFAIVLLILSIIIYPSIPEYLRLSLYWWPVLALLTLTFSLSENGVVSKVLNLRFLTRFGNISFTFYMIHVLGLYTIDIILAKAAFSMLPILNFCIVLFFDITAAILLNKYYEKPVRRLSSRT